MLLVLGSRNQEGRAASRRLLALGLREIWGLEEMPPVARGPMGKPCFPDLPDVHFNLSHSGELALCAFSDRPVGVDIEQVRPHRDGLPRYVLSDREYRWFLARGGGWELLCRLWTRKESWVKRTGGSIAGPSRICPPLPGERTEGLLLQDFAGEGWRAAVCAAEEDECTLQWRDFGTYLVDQAASD